MTEHRHQPRRKLTRRAADVRLIRVMLGIGIAFLIIAIVCSVVALKNSRDIAHNTKRDTYARDIAKWHADLAGCKNGSRIIRTYLLDKRKDAKVIGRTSVTPEVRRYFAAQVGPLKRRADRYRPEDCIGRYPKPATPAGFAELP